MSRELFIGLISGTSMDAMDCALVAIENDRTETIATLANPIPAGVYDNLARLMRNEGDLHCLGDTDVAVGHFIADTVQSLLRETGLKAADIRAIGSHGQTIWHEPPQSTRGHAFTLQLGDPNVIAERTGITTVADFRRRDMAAGGQGAPVVTALHAAMFRSDSIGRVVLNLGGIANITCLPADPHSPAVGLDTGPANVLMSEWIMRHRGLPYDDAGAWAASGRVDSELLALLLEEPYFSLPAPKSTGRELFNLPWLDRSLAQHGKDVAAADVQATLLQLTCESVARGIEQYMQDGELLVCGGGANNTALLGALRERLPAMRVGTTTEHGLDADFVEATAFAWFASRTLKRQPIDFAPFTGAGHAVIAGGVYFA